MELLFDEQIYHRIIQELLPSAEKFVWIATADLKDLHVDRGKKYLPFLSVLAELVSSGVQIRLMHAKEPGPRFRKDFDRYPQLIEGEFFERVLCPRLHAKIFIIDGKAAFTGSANLTGAGVGAKSPNRRNFESGVLFQDPQSVNELAEYFDNIWMGNRCDACQRKDVCPDPIA
ncbi:MAG: phospholipase D family protein [Verrucomicrobiota bacterium]